MKLIAILLSLLYLGITFINLIGSIHGSKLLPAFTLTFLIVALIVTWKGISIIKKHAKRKRYYVYFFLASLVLILFGPPGVFEMPNTV